MNKSVSIKDVSKTFKNIKALNKVSLEIPDGEIISLLGPSGSGKTTLLRIIAGLEQVDQGHITFKKKPSVTSPIILVYQDYILFPHLTVYENVVFGLRARKIYNREDLESRIFFYLNRFGIREKSGQYPAELSAGQKQRVALARAMVLEPMILLLDEPFANLDRNLKNEMALFLRETQKEFGTTMISVTHDQEEAFSMSDKIGVLINGELLQYDEVNTVYQYPVSLEVAQFFGPVNEIPQEVYSTFHREESHLEETEEERKPIFFIRPEEISLEPDPAGEGVIISINYAKHMIIYTVNIKNTHIKVYEIHQYLQVGMRVKIYILNHWRRKSQ